MTGLPLWQDVALPDGGVQEVEGRRGVNISEILMRGFFFIHVFSRVGGFRRAPTPTPSDILTPSPSPDRVKELVAGDPGVLMVGSKMLSPANRKKETLKFLISKTSQINKLVQII